MPLKRMTPAAIAAMFIIGAARAQCPVSMRAILDDYPATSSSSGLYGIPSATLDLPHAEGTRRVLLMGGVSRVLGGSSSPTPLGLVTWDGRHSGRIDGPPSPPSMNNYWSMCVDPTNAHVLAAIGGTIDEFVGTGWTAGPARPLDMIKQLFFWNGQLYLAGASDHPGPPTVYRRDGDQWAALPPFWFVSGAYRYDAVYGMCEHQGNLVVCGESGLYSWNGSSWALVATVPTGTRPYAVASFEGTIWVALGSSSTGPMTVRRRVGSQWQTMPLPPGTMMINDFNVLNGRLYASGRFNGPALMEWTGSVWRAAGTGVYGQIRSLGNWNGDVAVMGGGRDVSAVGAITFSNGTWQGLTTPTMGTDTLDGRFFVTLGGRRIIAGISRTVTGAVGSFVVWHDGTQWRPLAHPLPVGAMCEWNGEVAAVTSDPTDPKASLVYSLASVDATWTFRGKFRGEADSYGITSLTTRAGRLVAAGVFDSVSDGTTTTPANGVAELSPEGWHALGDPRALYVRDAQCRDGSLFMLAVMKGETRNPAYVTRVLEWQPDEQQWTQRGPNTEGQQLFLLDGAPVVAQNRSWGTASYVYPQGEAFMLRNGQWQNLGLPSGLIEQVDDRTIAVGNAPLRTTVQLYRFTFSADLAGGKDDNGDGVVDSADFARFADWMMTGDLRADLGSVGGTPVGDDLLDGNDWQVFFDMYFGGCRE